jgi:hypothetical protein
MVRGMHVDDSSRQIRVKIARVPYMLARVVHALELACQEEVRVHCTLFICSIVRISARNRTAHMVPTTLSISMRYRSMIYTDTIHRPIYC